MEKLRGILGRSGVNSSAAALAGALTTHAVTAAPSGLTATVTSAALAGAAASGSGALTLLAFMSMTKIQVGVAVGVVLAAALGIISLQTKNARLERQAAQLREQNETAERLRKMKAHETAARSQAAKRDPAPALAEPAR